MAEAIASNHPARLTHFLAIGPHVWGRGETVRGAIVEARANSKRATHFGVWKVSEHAYVDGMGGIVYDQSDPAPVAVGSFDRHARAVDRF
jgi:hypothetical protein